MSKCRELDALFAPYADGEAAIQDRASVEAHLERCPPCRDRIAIQRSVRGAMRAHRSTLRADASTQLRARCAAQARVSIPRPSIASRLTSPRWMPLSLAATLVLAIVGAIFLGVNNTVEVLAAQATLDHVTCFQFAPERLKHIDAATAAHDWTEKQGWAIEIPASSSTSDLELLGVRLCSTMTSGRVAHAMYKWHGRPLSVFIVPHSIGLHDQQEVVEKFGHEAVVWSDDNRTYVLLARAPPSELSPVVGYVREHAH